MKAAMRDRRRRLGAARGGPRPARARDRAAPAQAARAAARVPPRTAAAGCACGRRRPPADPETARVHAKLNSPQPTPNQGWLAISDSVFDQIPRAEMSPLASWASPPNSCRVRWADAASAAQHRVDDGGEQQRPPPRRESVCLSSQPQPASISTPSVPGARFVSNDAGVSSTPSRDAAVD